LDATVAKDATVALDATVAKEATTAKDATVALDSTVAKEATVAKDATVAKAATVAIDATVAKDATVALDATVAKSAALATAQLDLDKITGADGAILATDSVNPASIATNAIDADALAADAVAKIVADIFTETMPELAAGVPAAVPNLKQAIMLVYMGLRNKQTTTATAQTISNNAGATIVTSVLSDDATTGIKGEYA
jgi:carbonic anhydrase/acetyltransferase-like protein (isoleucine patch superfamily)